MSKYIFNKKEDSHLVLLKTGLLKISSKQYDDMFLDYINGVSVQDLCYRNNLDLDSFDEVRKILGWTRKSLVANIDSTEAEIEDQINVLDKRKVELSALKLKGKKNLADALKWQDFQTKKLDPFYGFIKTWEPKHKEKQYSVEKAPNKTGKHLVINLSDIHIGAIADGKYLFFQEDWNHSKLQKSMDRYLTSVIEEISQRKYSIEDVSICCLGDIIHTLTGFTDKGTKLESEFLSEKQLDFAFSIITQFIDGLLTVFKKINMYSVSGNHSSLGDYVVARFLEAYYKADKRISFNITSQRFLPFIIEDSLFVIEHGYSALYRSKMPPQGSARESYIQKILLSNPDLLTKTKYRYFVIGDQHTFSIEENTSYELIVCPSIVAGDRYSDNIMLKSRPRQLMFVVDKTGIKEIINIYFD